jgi:hypothetical protein
MLQNQARIGSTAIVSLIFGISAVILGPFTGILAVITGHLALWRIKRSGGALRGKGLAVAGLILGYGFSALSVIPDHLAIRKVKTITTLATAASIEAAVDSFHTEYGSLPSDAGADLTIHTHADTRLLEVLLGLDVKRNPREMWSDGPDRKPGTTDDVKTW